MGQEAVCRGEFQASAKCLRPEGVPVLEAQKEVSSQLGGIAHQGSYRLHPGVEDFRRAVTIQSKLGSLLLLTHQPQVPTYRTILMLLSIRFVCNTMWWKEHGLAWLCNRLSESLCKSCPLDLSILQ